MAQEQGTEEWRRERLGKITASRFKDMMTNGRGKDTMGKTAYSYMYDLIAERLTGIPQDEISAKAIQWGNDNEPQARAMYCLRRDVRVEQVGFLVKHGFKPWYTECGGSPDGLILEYEKGPDGKPDGHSLGGVEIKCPLSSRIHLGYIEDGVVPSDYYWQVQGLLWVTGRDWWDFVSFDPRMPENLQLFVFREYPDPDAHADLEERVERFLEQIAIKLDKVRKRQQDADADVASDIASSF